MRYIKIVIILFIMVLGIQSHVFALEDLKLDETKKVFTIEECINYALANDPNIKVAKDKVKVQKSKVGQAKSDYFPTLGLGNGYTFYSNKIDDNDLNTSHSYSLDASVNQLIWNFGRTTANINMQKYNHKSSEFDLDYEILVTIYKVKMAYFAVLAAKASNDVSERTVRINKLNYDRTKALFEEGLKSKIDVVNAEVHYTDSKVQLLDAQEAYKEAVIDLANAMYYVDSTNFSVTNTENFNFVPVNYTPASPDTSFVPQLKDGDHSEMILTSGIEKTNILKNFTFNPYDITVEDAIQQAYINRPDLKSLELVKKASEESLKAIKRSYYPELGASAGYGLSKTQENLSNSFRVYAGLDFPMINIMNIKCKIDEGKSYLDIATENVDLAKKNIYFEVQNYYVAMKQLEKRIPLMADKVEQTLENFELADGRYTTGLGNFIELQEAQTNYNNAQLEFVQSVFRYNVAKEQFLKSMGVR